MNNRQRFYATMHYLPRDRSPIVDFGFWEETIAAWQEQGLPKHVYFREGVYNTDEFFGMDYGLDQVMDTIGVSSGLRPPFPEQVLEDHGDREVVQQSDGVRVLRHKRMSSIPKPVEHLLVDRVSWRQYYLPRLDPTNPERYPADWDRRVSLWRNAERDQVLALPGGSLFGWLRNWMGLEQLAYVLHDDPAWFEEMVTTVADCIVGTLTRILETGGHFDACAMWEDMCYNAGPLLGPRHFRQYLVPHYRRIVDLVHRYGVDVVWVDCDGRVDALLPLWLEAGVNCLLPVEIGTWGADPVRYRQEYGPGLLLMGGFDKNILRQGRAEIEQEVHRLAPLVEEGGFIGFCDHRVPPDVPLDHYTFYVETAWRVWGKEQNLEGMP